MSSRGNTMENLFEDKNDVDTFRRMNKDVNDYVNGKSQYVKGKGWQ